MAAGGSIFGSRREPVEERPDGRRDWLVKNRPATVGDRAVQTAADGNELTEIYMRIRLNAEAEPDNQCCATCGNRLQSGAPRVTDKINNWCNASCATAYAARGAQPQIPATQAETRP
jgi:hypothetical protein